VAQPLSSLTKSGQAVFSGHGSVVDILLIEHNIRIGLVYSHPCKKCKDGAPSVQYESEKIKIRAPPVIDSVARGNPVNSVGQRILSCAPVSFRRGQRVPRCAPTNAPGSQSRCRRRSRPDTSGPQSWKRGWADDGGSQRRIEIFGSELSRFFLTGCP